MLFLVLRSAAVVDFRLDDFDDRVGKCIKASFELFFFVVDAGFELFLFELHARFDVVEALLEYNHLVVHAGHINDHDQRFFELFVVAVIWLPIIFEKEEAVGFGAQVRDALVPREHVVLFV